MTTNKPGSVNQQPLYGCTSCYEECTYPADHLHVHDGECWCDFCWDARRGDFPDQPDWGDLETYTPALQAECEKLRKDAERYVPLHEAVQRAAGELPAGWVIQLCVERHSGWVELIGPDGTEDFDTNNERLDYTVIDALEAAMQGGKA